MGFSIIVAHDLQRGIGVDGTLPWSFPEDMKHFRRVTLGVGTNVVIMGRRTWESIPIRFRPLTKRKNIVLTSNPSRVDQKSMNSLESALVLAEEFQKQHEQSEIFVIGGAQVYDQALNHPECERLFVTKIHQHFNCDVFFPQYEDRFQIKHVRKTASDEALLSFEEWSR